MSWSARLLPFLEQDELWSQAQQAFAEQPFFRLHAVGYHVLRVFTCPADDRIQYPFKNWPGFTSYLGVEGKDLQAMVGVLFLNSAVRMADITDGTSRTLLVGERPPSADYGLGWWYGGWGQDKEGSLDLVLGVHEKNIFGPWWQNGADCPAGPYQFSPGQVSNNCDAFHFWSLHSQGAHFLMADGSVHFFSYSAAPLMAALASRRGGEPVEPPN
jgi:prepilin-type processing-associated H-X9-DG protein